MRRTITTAVLVAGLVNAAGAKIVLLFSERCPCYWRADGVEWTSRLERVRCAAEVIRAAVEAGDLTAADGTRQVRVAKHSRCGLRSFTFRETCGGPAHRTCRARYYKNRCNIVDAACTGTRLGWCTSPCASQGTGGRPVCGCDGVTYPSFCRLLDAEVALAHTGSCEAGPSAP